jgi:hypothetical protein
MGVKPSKLVVPCSTVSGTRFWQADGRSKFRRTRRTGTAALGLARVYDPNSGVLLRGQGSIFSVKLGLRSLLAASAPRSAMAPPHRIEDRALRNAEASLMPPPATSWCCRGRARWARAACCGSSPGWSPGRRHGASDGRQKPGGPSRWGGRPLAALVCHSTGRGDRQ